MQINGEGKEEKKKKFHDGVRSSSRALLKLDNQEMSLTHCVLSLLTQLRTLSVKIKTPFHDENKFLSSASLFASDLKGVLYRLKCTSQTQ